MKVFAVVFTLLISFTSTAQLTYIGDDVIQRNYDGYTASKQTPGLVSLDGKYYFITPNGNFYQTDGTQANTKIEKQFSPQTVAYLKATNKYVYFAYGSGYIGDLARYSPATGLSIVTNPTDNNAFLYLNSQVVPGNNFLVDEAFTNFDNDAFLIRKFTKDVFYIYIINDHNDNAKAHLVFTQKLNNNYVTTPISVNTTVETFKTDVYCNGRERPTGVYQTTVNINKRTANDNTKYEFKTNFSTLKNGLFPYDRFLRTKNNIYSLYKVIDSAANKKYLQLYSFNEKNITPTKSAVILTEEDVDTQIMDGEIYFSCKGRLVKFNESKAEYEFIFFEKDGVSAWQNIAKNTRFLKAGQYYMYRRNNALSVYNSTLKTTNTITGAFWHPNTNYFTQHKVEAYAGKNSFYFTKRINDKVSFVRYNPVANTETPIEFPEFKKEKFEEIKAIFHNGNRFVFLTGYKGKKGKSVYKMFMYTEDGAALAAVKAPVITAAPKVEPKPETKPKPLDINSFNKKLFTEQLKKIISNQGNQFEDIKGESITSEFGNRSKSTVTLEGFGEGTIINYKSVSKLFRYEAETVTIKGKANALAFLDVLDKEVQNLIANNGIQRVVELDVKVRKQLNYIFTGAVGYDATEIKFLQLDAYCNSGFENPDDAVFTITIRVDKPAR
jgi:hypothetical protein